MTVFLKSLSSFSIPLVHPIHIGSNVIADRTGLFVTLGDSDGFEGLGEIAPLPGFHNESWEECLELLKSNQPTLENLQIETKEGSPNKVCLGDLMGSIDDFIELPTVHFGLAMALLNVFSARLGCQPAKIISQNPLLDLPINGLVTSPPNQWLKDTLERIGQGYSTIKVKVGREAMQTETAALKNLLAQTVSPISFILDGNRAWEFSQAKEFLKQLSASRIAYCEELLTNPRELAGLQQQTGIPMALDETLFEAKNDADLVRRWESVYVLKPDRIKGTLEQCLNISYAAQDRNQSVVVSSAYNTPLGASFLAQLAAALHSPHAGLDTCRWYDNTLAGNLLPGSNGTISIPDSWINTIENFTPFLNRIEL